MGSRQRFSKKKREEGSFNKWRRKKGEANAKSQLATYTARLEELLKIKNPNDAQKNQIANARRLKNEATKSINKSGTGSGGTGSGGKKLSTSVRGEQKKAEKLKVNKSEKEKKKIPKKKGNGVEDGHDYAKENAEFNDWATKRKPRLAKEKAAKKETPKVKKKITARSRMRARNEEIHGKSMQPLIDKNKAFQAAKKKKGGMDEFAKKYPNSQTAKERKRRLKVTTWRDLE